MALNYKTYYAMPYLASYEEASKYEASVKPIRGDDQQRKPLGRRNQKWRRIQREMDNSITIYDWYDEWLICYHPNGELHLRDKAYWNKASQNEVMQRVTGLHCRTEAGRVWVRYDGGITPLMPMAKRVFDAQAGVWVKQGDDPEPTIFVKNERDNWVCKNASSIITHVVDRKGSKAVRQRYAAGLGYIKALASLRKDSIPKHEELVDAFRDTLLGHLPKGEEVYYYRTRQIIPPVGHHMFTHTHAAYLAGLIGSKDPNDQYKAFLWLMREEYVTKTVLRRADAVLMMHHHDEWFKECEHAPGSKAIDRYKWAFPEKSQTA